ncbi:DUF1810 family protein [Mucilaginibacter polytrichastri]|uniref:DUF1810 family protein n=1 Tax=Mucilaginibacter polytrichastri TaxID=1302689 RepID=UPI0011136221
MQRNSNNIYWENLIAIASTLLIHEWETASEIFGAPDDMKLRSSMTLFTQVQILIPYSGKSC